MVQNSMYCGINIIDALVGLLFVLGVVIGMVDGEGKVGLGWSKSHNNLANKPLVIWQIHISAEIRVITTDTRDCLIY